MPLVRNWWPLAVFVVATFLLQTLWTARYEVVGHAAGHLGSATAIFAGGLLLTVAAWAAPPGRRRDVAAWVCGAGVLVGHALVMLGNVQVITAIGDRDWSDEQAWELGDALPGFVAGHDLAGRGALLAVGASVVLALVLVRRRLVSRRAGFGAAGLSLVFPYFLAPGAGLAVLAVSLCLARRRRISASVPARGLPTEWAGPPDSPGTWAIRSDRSASRGDG